MTAQDDVNGMVDELIASGMLLWFPEQGYYRLSWVADRFMGACGLEHNLVGLIVTVRQFCPKASLIRCESMTEILQDILVPAPMPVRYRQH